MIYHKQCNRMVSLQCALSGDFVSVKDDKKPYHRYRTCMASLQHAFLTCGTLNGCDQ